MRLSMRQIEPEPMTGEGLDMMGTGAMRMALLDHKYGGDWRHADGALEP